MGSWTGKLDPLRAIHDKVKKSIGFDPSLASNIHTKLANKAHAAADNYLNQQPVGSENRAKNRRDAEDQYLASRGRQADYDTPRQFRKNKRLTIMGGS